MGTPTGRDDDARMEAVRVVVIVDAIYVVIRDPRSREVVPLRRHEDVDEVSRACEATRRIREVEFIEMQVVRELGLVMAGGALGSGARYLVGQGALVVVGKAFPWGTLAVNVVGSFLIILIAAAATGKEPTISPETRIFLATGIMGGFTTYSSFNWEALNYFHDGNVGRGLLYMAATIFLCLAGGALGYVVSRSF
jgi:CrcB protein